MRKVLFVAAGVLLVAGSGALAWWKLRPQPPVAEPAAEKSYEEIERPDYEHWMQDLGYTE